MDRLVSIGGHIDPPIKTGVFAELFCCETCRLGFGFGIRVERSRTVRRLVQREKRLAALGYDCPTDEEQAANQRAAGL